MPSQIKEGIGVIGIFALWLAMSIGPALLFKQGIGVALLAALAVSALWAFYINTHNGYPFVPVWVFSFVLTLIGSLAVRGVISLTQN